MSKGQKLFAPVKKLRKDIVVRISNNDSICDERSNVVAPSSKLNFESLDIMLKFKTVSIPEKYGYISDYFMQEYMKWYQDTYIFINTGTGTGKTTFIEKLASLGKFHVLVLTNRKANRKQILNHLKSKNCYGVGVMVKVLSYQELEKEKEVISDVLDLYDYIVCDESHYFLADSDFNSLTNISLMKIMGTTRAIKVFMSATNQYIQEKIIKRLQNRYRNDLTVAQKVFIYNMNKSSTMIRNIIGFESFERDLMDKIIDSQDKWLIFVKSISQGREMYYSLTKQLKDNVIFLDRESADEGTENQKQTFKVLIEEELIYQKVVISTCLLDNGINLRDKQLKNIVCFEDDPVEIVQMIGRKRSICFDDYFDLYLINESNQSLSVSYCNAIARKKKFISVKKDIEEYHELNPRHYLNTKEGVEYRNMSYYHPYAFDYYFNYLGYSKVCREIKNINELRIAESPFDVKVNWVLNKVGSTILGKMTTSNQLSVEKFINSIESLIGEEFAYKSKRDKINFHSLISNYFWMWFKKLNGERADRPMNLNKLEEKFLVYKIPLVLVVSDEKIKIMKNRGRN